MKIIAAPNAFKGSLTAVEVAAAISDGAKAADPHAEVITVPLADGGDGLATVMAQVLNGDLLDRRVSGPLDFPVTASLCHVAPKRLVVIESALASGMALLSSHELDPEKTTTRGTGELILAALDLGAETIHVGIGGSATNDCGMGMASALGVLFLDENGAPVLPVGGSLGDVSSIHMEGLDPRLKNVCIKVICDVDNPLTGKNGAARVYAPQKGASAMQVERLEAGLSSFADIIKRDLGVDISNMPGAGAAGGLGGGLYAFLGATLCRGIDVVLELVDFEEILQGADLVITGEGRIDSQSLSGKAPAGVGAAAKKKDIPCIAIAGSMGNDLQGIHRAGISAVFSICKGPVTLDYAMKEAGELIRTAAEQAVRCFMAGRTIGNP